jgi:hypothetical protein
LEVGERREVPNLRIEETDRLERPEARERYKIADLRMGSNRSPEAPEGVKAA